MNMFDFLTDAQRNALFCIPPQPFDRRTEKDRLRYAVGALLYTPATNPKIADILLAGRIRGLTSLAICLEDAVGDSQLQAAFDNLQSTLRAVREAVQNGTAEPAKLPLLFVRVRDLRMLAGLRALLAEYAGLLCGVILPKVTSETLEPLLLQVREIASTAGQPLYAMPILESEEIITSTERCALLARMRDIVDRYAPYVLNLRIGATDFSGLFGLRRSMDATIYDIHVVRACIEDIVRTFALADRYTVSAPVWEYFGAAQPSRDAVDCPELAGLLRETALDLQNGLNGKTCVHPSQLVPVQSMHAVPFEQYQDAALIAGSDRREAGVLASGNGNKMNELKPHALWARRILCRASVYGVYNRDKTYRDLLREYADSAPSAGALSLRIGEVLQLDLRVRQVQFGLDVQKLFGLAVRKNPNRPFLFVSKVLGKHFPMHPAKLLAAAGLLAAAACGETACRYFADVIGERVQPSFEAVLQEAEKRRRRISPAEKTLFIGFAETATGLAQSVFHCFEGDAVFANTTRLQTGDESFLDFLEEHSHAMQHYLYLGRAADFLRSCQNIVLIDDELTTGNTILNIVREIYSRYHILRYLVLTILDWRSKESRDRFTALEQELGICIRVVSLVAGEIASVRFAGLPDGQARYIEGAGMPVKTYVKREAPAFAQAEFAGGRCVRAEGRFALLPAEHRKAAEDCRALAKQLQEQAAGKKILCVGTGEFIFLPMFTAGFLGPDVVYQSTTQSPVLPMDDPGCAIRQGAKFAPLDCYSPVGYLYNVPENAYDAAFVFVEACLAREEGVAQLVSYLESRGIRQVTVLQL